VQSSINNVLQILLICADVNLLPRYITSLGDMDDDLFEAVKIVILELQRILTPRRHL